MHFNSHAHVERDFKRKNIRSMRTGFQLTRSRGAWLYTPRSLNSIGYFNSHAHVERDEMFSYFVNKFGISTHTLTWSVTLKVQKPLFYNVFQLTRSRGAWHSGFATGTNYQDFNSHAHVERDKITDSNLKTCWYFNSHAHVERDRNSGKGRFEWEISTHTLTWSVTQILAEFFSKIPFQLTRSRGAWQQCYPW